MTATPDAECDDPDRSPAGAAIAAADPPAQLWPDLAKCWNQLGPPLRPCDEDVALFSAAMARRAGPGAPRVLILGVTPELHALARARGAVDVLAIDRTRRMIDAVWPGPPGTVVCAEWADLPLAPRARDVVLCDGGLVQLDPSAVLRLAASLRRIVTPGGVCAFRLFVPPPRRETPAAVFADLFAGAIPDLNALKLRLAMALTAGASQGVELARVHAALSRVAPDLHALAIRLGWPTDPMRAIELYRDCPTRYRFPTVADVRDAFEADVGGFTLTARETPNYALGERCPMVTFRRH